MVLVHLLYEVDENKTIDAFLIVMPRIFLTLHTPDAFLLHAIVSYLFLEQNDHPRFTIRLPVSYSSHQCEDLPEASSIHWGQLTCSS